MARRADDNDLALFAEDDLGPDHSNTNKMMDNRARLDMLSVQEKAKLADALVAFNLTGPVGGDPDEDIQVRDVEIAFQDFLAEQLDALGGEVIDRCFYCKEPIEPDAERLIRLTGWVGDLGDKRVRCREATSEVAHDYCVDRVSEGGDPSAKPMF